MVESHEAMRTVAYAFGGAGVLAGLSAWAGGKAAIAASYSDSGGDSTEKSQAKTSEISMAVACGAFGVGAILYFIIMMAAADNRGGRVRRAISSIYGQPLVKL